MKNSILFIFFLLLNFSSINAQNASLKSQDINWLNDTMWINNNIIIPEGEKLIISPGTVVVFLGNYSIEVNGKIEALGNEMDSIVFTVNDTTNFSDTTSYLGGWGSIKLMNNQTDTSTFRFCKFSYGKAILPGVFYYDPDIQDNKGGAIYANNYDNILISNSKFENNYANYSGAGINIQDCQSVFIENSVFINNHVLCNGAGANIANYSTLIVINCLFFNNIAFNITHTIIGDFGAGSGGGLFLSANLNSQEAVIMGNKFANNFTVGGSLYESTSKTLVVNNIIANNAGKAVFSGTTLGQSVYLNNIIVNNIALYDGPGFYLFSEDIQLKNNIIWGNESLYLDSTQYGQIDTGEDFIANVEYSCIQDGYAGEGNISNFPQFTNPTEGAGIEYDGLSADWTLLETSPCINTGTSDTTGLNLPEFDIAGNPRVFGGRIDMGAYENQSVYVKINDSPVYSEIKLYPNPGTDKIYIDIPPEINGSWIDIVDGQGKVLMHEQITYSPSVLSPFKLKSGIYFYRIYSDNEVVKSGKWIKR